LSRLSLIDNHTLHEVSIVCFTFAFLLFVEAFGLLRQKVWAEFLTVAETALFIPFELYEIIRHITITKSAILAVNCAIVIYLLREIMRKASAKNKF
ncbi:MAG TPA: DUF2127 domain-containing protein, partial [Fibrobacteres bacterium]|nr:DUF2127 domain-containing protein [Fibrobacterota bacterium]